MRHFLLFQVNEENKIQFEKSYKAKKYQNRSNKNGIKTNKICWPEKMAVKDKFSSLLRRKNALIIIFILFGFSYILINNNNKQTNNINIASSQVRNGLKKVRMEHCDCERLINMDDSNEDAILFNETTCSRDVFQRGSKQKVVGFSFYGDINAAYSKKKGYFEGEIHYLKTTANASS